MLNIKITKQLVWILKYLCVWKEFLPQAINKHELSNYPHKKPCVVVMGVALCLYWQIIVHIMHNDPIQPNLSVIQHCSLNQIYISTQRTTFWFIIFFVCFPILFCLFQALKHDEISNIKVSKSKRKNIFSRQCSLKVYTFEQSPSLSGVEMTKTFWIISHRSTSGRCAVWWRVDARAGNESLNLRCLNACLE